MNNNLDGFFWLNVMANLAQLESYQLLLKDANNDDIMHHLDHQDRILNEQINSYLKRIVDQNEEIINLLKKKGSE